MAREGSSSSSSNGVRDGQAGRRLRVSEPRKSVSAGGNRILTAEKRGKDGKFLSR
jgi:hypothetical protein